MPMNQRERELSRRDDGCNEKKRVYIEEMTVIDTVMRCRGIGGSNIVDKSRSSRQDSQMLVQLVIQSVNPI